MRHLNNTETVQTYKDTLPSMKNMEVWRLQLFEMADLQITHGRLFRNKDMTFFKKRN